MPAPTASAPEAAAARDKADGLFLKLLDQSTSRGANLSASPTANNFAPTVFAKTPEAKTAQLKKADFVAALNRLFEASKITSQTYGPPSRSATRIVRT